MTVGAGRRGGGGASTGGGGRSLTGALMPALRTSARVPPSLSHARSRAGGADRGRAARAIPSRRPAGRGRRPRVVAALPPGALHARRAGTRARRSPRRCRDARASGGGSPRDRRTRFRARPRGSPRPRERSERAPRRPPPRRRPRSGSPARSPPSSPALGSGLLRVAFVRLDDALDELVPNDVLVRELDEPDAFDRAE